MTISTLPPPARRVAGVRSSPVRDLLALTAHRDVISFAGGLPDPALFDTAGLGEAFAAALRADTLQYSTSEGDPRLRGWIAAAAGARGVPTGPDDVVITTGSQQALGLVASTLLDPGDVVLVESPSYLAALQTFALAGARLVAVPGDADGPDPEALVDLARRHAAKLLYLVPTFHNPTGRTIPTPRRAALAQATQRAGVYLVEDDPYWQLRYDGEPVEPLAAHPAAADRTILLGSFSKVLAPGLRLGWLRVPPALRPAVVVSKQAADLHTSTIDQAAVAHYLGDDPGRLTANVARMCAAYRSRRDTLLAGLGAALPAGSRWTEPAGGMFVWAQLPDGLDAASLLPAALEAGVAFVPGAACYAAEPISGTIRLNLTANPEPMISEGLTRLGVALSEAPAA